MKKDNLTATDYHYLDINIKHPSSNTVSFRDEEKVIIILTDTYLLNIDYSSYTLQVF